MKNKVVYLRNAIWIARAKNTGSHQRTITKQCNWPSRVDLKESKKKERKKERKKDSEYVRKRNRDKRVERVNLISLI